MGPKQSESIAVLQGGTLSLPASFKRRLGMRDGRAFIVEEHGNTLLLKPFEIEHYSDEQVTRWKKEGRMTNGERATLRKKILNRRK